MRRPTADLSSYPAQVPCSARPPSKQYLYEDYYRQRFERNRGLRIDFLLGSPALAERVTGAFIDTDERDPAKREELGKPSDHAAVVVDLSD